MEFFPLYFCIISLCIFACICHGAQHITWQDMSMDGLHESEGSSRGQVIVVSKDGKGDSNTVQGAVDLVPKWNKERVKIVIHPGIYREKVRIPITKPYISFIGRDKSNTKITYSLKASDKDSHGQAVGTYDSASVAVESDYFCAKGVTFENTVTDNKAGDDGMQAVALRLSGDKAMLYDCNIIGSQDTLFDHQGRHYFLNCFIQGSIDFIFGNAASLYKECTLQATASGYGAFAASQRNSPSENTGYSFVNCDLKGTGMVYLGRAWGKYARIVYSYCKMDGNVVPEGWNDWGDSSRRSTVSFGEYQCSGRGAYSSKRAKWARSLSSNEAKQFVDQNFINGEQWLSL